MRILLISSLYGATGGGAGLTVSHLAHGLSALGNQVVVITIGKDSQYTDTEEHGLHIYRFRPLNIYPLEGKDTEPLWKRMIWQFVDVYNFHNARMLHQILERESPDIVHIHKMRGFSGAVWPVTCQLFPGRVIQTCHDYESISPDGILRGAIGRMALRRQWPIRGYQLVRARLSAAVSGVTAPNAFTLNRITNTGLFPSAKQKVIPNTHGWSQRELELIHQKPSDFSGDNVRFLFLGRLEREKGIVELCEAFRQALDLFPLLQLDIAGWGSLDSQLRTSYGKFPNVNFLGVVNGKSKEDALSRATVVVLSSTVDEVFPLVVAEAFAFGKPVIASNVGGLPELIRHGETGWLVEAGNIQALTKQLQSVSQISPLLLAEMSHNCKEISHKFSMEKILMEYIELYRQFTE